MKQRSSILIVVLLSASVAVATAMESFRTPPHSPSPAAPAASSVTPMVYVPLVSKPAATPTPTSTPTASPTPTVTSTPTATPTRTATPTLPPPSFNECQEDPNPAIAPNYPVKIVSVNKVTEVVTLQNVSHLPISLEDWNMCSINGNQAHDDIFGNIPAGETRTFPYAGGGSIWNDTLRDDGALYNANGSLVSYWIDQ